MLRKILDGINPSSLKLGRDESGLCCLFYYHVNLVNPVKKLFMNPILKSAESVQGQQGICGLFS